MSGALLVFGTLPGPKTGAPLVVYGDAQAALATHLRRVLEARPEPYAARAVVRTRIPQGKEPYAAQDPLVVVRQDSPGTVRQHVATVASLRVMVWHSTDDDAYDLAQLAHALAVTHSGPVLRRVRTQLSPFGSADPDTGEPMASFTVTGTIRPITLNP